MTPSRTCHYPSTHTCWLIKTSLRGQLTLVSDVSMLSPDHCLLGLKSWLCIARSLASSVSTSNSTSSLQFLILWICMPSILLSFLQSSGGRMCVYVCDRERERWMIQRGKFLHMRVYFPLLTLHYWHWSHTWRRGPSDCDPQWCVFLWVFFWSWSADHSWGFPCCALSGLLSASSPFIWGMLYDLPPVFTNTRDLPIW